MQTTIHTTDINGEDISVKVFHDGIDRDTLTSVFADMDPEVVVLTVTMPWRKAKFVATRRGWTGQQFRVAAA